MDDLHRRLASLPPEKRRLLELRLGREGLEPPRAEGAEPPPAAGPAAVAPAPAGGPAPMQFSLFFFSADGSTVADDKYRLLLDSARFADCRGFTAVWTPERHFVDFGGLYPNPSLLGAALAVATERLQIRAGSVVVPLHNPVRLAEEWAVVDNLSRGRAAIACATGWHPDDFVLQPGAYAERRELTFRNLELLRRLWAGEEVPFPADDGHQVAVRTLPRPVQPELPIWITSSGNTATWERAGEVGANVLSSMGSQPFADLAAKVERYRAARRRGGHDPETGVVTLMLHTFLGRDLEEVKAKVRGPLTGYLRTHLEQRESFLELPGITADDKEALLPLAFEHYVHAASLLGTPEACSTMVDRLAAVGVDEVACLIDFGLPYDEVMASLELLDGLRQAHAPAAAEVAR